MYTMLDAHFLTVIVIVGSIMITPFSILGVYVFSKASPQKGFTIGSIFLIWGALMSWVCLRDVPARLGIAGNLIVPFAWILPSLILYWRRDWFLSERLSQKWLIGLNCSGSLAEYF